MRLLLVDDHDVVRAGLMASLATKHTVVGMAGSGEQALHAAARVRPAVAVIDYRLPDMTGEELCRRLREQDPNLAVMVLSTYISDDVVRRTLSAGAFAYVTKAAGLHEVLRVLSDFEHGTLPAATTGETVARLHASATHGGHLDLSPQQSNVLELAAEGLTNAQIGKRLFISESTVRFHLQNLKAKFEARTKTDLIARALRAGAISPAPEDEPP